MKRKPITKQGFLTKVGFLKPIASSGVFFSKKKQKKKNVKKKTRNQRLHTSIHYSYFLYKKKKKYIERGRKEYFLLK